MPKIQPTAVDQLQVSILNMVASEVRNLVQRSPAAGKEIKTLIGDSIEKLDAGARLVDVAGRG